MIEFTVVYSPRAQMRARNRVVRTREGKYFTSTYKDPKQALEEEKIGALINLFYEHKPPEPLSGALFLGVKAYLPIAESKMKGRKGLAFLQGVAMQTERPPGKPDMDNLLKNIKDVFKGVFWKDDSLVVEYLPGTGKYWGEPARWEIQIMTLAEFLSLTPTQYLALRGSTWPASPQTLDAPEKGGTIYQPTLRSCHQRPLMSSCLETRMDSEP